MNRGESNPNSKLTEVIVDRIRSDYAEGASIQDVCAKYEASESAVRRVLAGLSWRHITGGVNIIRYQREEVNHGRKLTMEQAEAVRRVYHRFRIEQTELAELLGITQNSVSDIINNRSYLEQRG